MVFFFFHAACCYFSHTLLFFFFRFSRYAAIIFRCLLLRLFRYLRRYLRFFRHATSYHYSADAMPLLPLIITPAMLFWRDDATRYIPPCYAVFALFHVAQCNGECRLSHRMPSRRQRASIFRYADRCFDAAGAAITLTPPFSPMIDAPILPLRHCLYAYATLSPPCC